MVNSLKGLENLFSRDLERLKTELEEIPESELWDTKEGIINSCGVLAQHLVGNLNHYIGYALGNTGYERDRDREFTNTGISKSVLIKDVEDTKAMISRVFDELSEQDLEKKYPINIPFDASVSQFLFHLYGHLNYHLGQVNYLRRILSENRG